jgi:hypothetical protein
MRILAVTFHRENYRAVVDATVANGSSIAQTYEIWESDDTTSAPVLRATVSVGANSPEGSGGPDGPEDPLGEKIICNCSPAGACLKGLPGAGRWAGRRSTVVAAA